MCINRHYTVQGYVICFFSTPLPWQSCLSDYSALVLLFLTEYFPTQALCCLWGSFQSASLLLKMITLAMTVMHPSAAPGSSAFAASLTIIPLTFHYYSTVQRCSSSRDTCHKFLINIIMYTQFELTKPDFET